MVPAFLGPGSGSFHLESLCVRSMQVRRILLPSGKAPLQWLALPCRRVDFMFVSFLADSTQHSSIKVYLSAVRSLHIEQGFPDPLLNCLQLQRVLRGVKRSQGSPAAQCLPITDSLLLVIHRALDLEIFDHCDFWAACMLGYFGFLHATEFTVPNLVSSSPAIHLSVADITAGLKV